MDTNKKLKEILHEIISNLKNPSKTVGVQTSQIQKSLKMGFGMVFDKINAILPKTSNNRMTIKIITPLRIRTPMIYPKYLSPRLMNTPLAIFLRLGKPDYRNPDTVGI